MRPTALESTVPLTKTLVRLQAAGWPWEMKTGGTCISPQDKVLVGHRPLSLTLWCSLMAAQPTWILEIQDGGGLGTATHIPFLCKNDYLFTHLCVTCPWPGSYHSLMLVCHTSLPCESSDWQMVPLSLHSFSRHLPGD